MEVLGDDVARANLLHAEHEHREERVLDLRVIRVLQGLLTDELNQALYGLLKVFEWQLGQAFILSTQAASRYFFTILILDVKNLCFLFQVLKE